mgnify:CR=1 FL=1
MTRVVRQARLAPDAAEVVMRPRGGFVIEREVAPGVFDAEVGPVSTYRREMVTEPASDGRVGVRQTVEFRLLAPFTAWLFVLPTRRLVGRIGPEPARPWWSPPDTLDSRSSMVLSLAAVLAVAFVLFGVSGVNGRTIDVRAYPVASVRYLERTGLRGPEHRLATTDVVGCWLVLRDGRSARVFIDDRVDMYPVEVTKDYVALLRGEARAVSVLDRHDIDVVLDLMIHDLDLILSMVPSEVDSVEAVGVPVLTPKIDIANARVRFRNGCIANLTASRISRDQIRKIRFFQRERYLSIDTAAREVEMYQLVPQPAGLPKIDGGKLTVPGDEPLKRELEDFVAAVRDRRAPQVSGEQGRAALALAIRIVELMRQ